MLKKAYHGFSFIILLYTVGIFVGLLFVFLCFIKRIDVKNRSFLKELKNGKLYGRNGVFIVSNHPSLLEPFLIPALFFPNFLLNPFKFFPWSTPDKRNFSVWYAWPVRMFRSIPIQREKISVGSSKFSFSKIVERLKKGERVIFFPEGGRTYKKDEKIKSALGKEIGALKNGAEKIIENSNSVILPIWVENTDKVLPPRRWIPDFCKSQIVFKIGEPIFKNINTEELQKIILELADR